MKRYFVITHKAENNGHLNEQDLLPASCKLITGVAVNATVKQEAELRDVAETLPFPQALITGLLKGKRITGLFYSYLRTRSNEADSRAYFNEAVLPEIISELAGGIRFDCLDGTQQEEMANNLTGLFNEKLADRLYNVSGLYAKGQEMTDADFRGFIAQETLTFAYENRETLFNRTAQAYERPKAYECGNISLLVNGNSFLLRDYTVTANKKVKHMAKEIIPFHEPLGVNSNMHTVFKNNKNNGGNALAIRIYIEYEHK